MPPTPSAAPVPDVRQMPDRASGGGAFLLHALQAAGPEFQDALRDLQGDAVVSEPRIEPALSGMNFIEYEFERLQTLPFAESSDGSEIDPPIAARDVHLAMRLRHRPRHWHAVTGAHLPEQATIIVTIDPDASRAEVSELLLHELAHAATPTPRSPSGRRTVHGREFRAMLILAAKEAYDVNLDPDTITWSSWRIDDAIVRALHALGGEWRLPVGT